MAKKTGTYFQTTEEGIKARKWLVVDAAGIPLGRLASQVAALLRGKHRVEFTTHVAGGDNIIVINASKVKLTGNKASTKLYRHHTGYIGGVKTIVAGDLLAENPERMITLAVKGMIPRGPLYNNIMTQLHVFADDQHPHQAQKPEAFTLKYTQA